MCNLTDYTGNWDYGASVDSFDLGNPIASKWHISMHQD